MKHFTKEQFKELKEAFLEMSAMAHQSGKKETSDLVDTILKKVETSVDKTVNGKIKILDAKVTDYILRDDKWKEFIGKDIKENTEYRLQTTGGLVLMRWTLGFVGAGTFISIIMNLYG